MALPEYKIKRNLQWQELNQPIIKKYVADLYQEFVPSTIGQTSGTLIPGIAYIIYAVNAGDVFTNVGFVSTGQSFTASLATPTTWTNGTIVYKVDTKASTPVATELTNNTDVAFQYEYIDAGVYFVTSSKPIFVDCGMGCPVAQHTQVAITNTLAYAFGPDFGIVAYPIFDDIIVVLTFTSTGVLTDNILGNYLQNALEITVYPQS